MKLITAQKSMYLSFCNVDVFGMGSGAVSNYTYFSLCTHFYEYAFSFHFIPILFGVYVREIKLVSVCH